jgi:hypothetical protein
MKLLDYFKIKKLKETILTVTYRCEGSTENIGNPVTIKGIGLKAIASYKLMGNVGDTLRALIILALNS